jgi:hypothetical protein
MKLSRRGTTLEFVHMLLYIKRLTITGYDFEWSVALYPFTEYFLFYA